MRLSLQRLEIRRLPIPGLNEKVLVLNRSWTPIGVVSARKAIGLVAVERAAIVCPKTYVIFDLMTWIDRPLNGEPWIQAVSFAFARPDVILLRHPGRHAPLPLRFSRRAVFQRDRHTCQYCGSRPGPSRLTVDHVLPKSRGGKTTWENCVTACQPCNRRKADGRPGEHVPQLRHKPHRPHWTSLIDQRPTWQSFLGGAIGA